MSEDVSILFPPTPRVFPHLRPKSARSTACCDGLSVAVFEPAPQNAIREESGFRSFNPCGQRQRPVHESGERFWFQRTWCQVVATAIQHFQAQPLIRTSENAIGKTGSSKLSKVAAHAASPRQEVRDRNKDADPILLLHAKPILQ